MKCHFALLGFALALLLIALPVHGQTPDYQYIDVGDYRLAYLCKGSGDLTVLMVSGMGLDAYATFKNTFENAPADGYQLCLYDRAGTGPSAYEHPKARPMRALAEELKGFVNALGLKRVILAPHSFGGMVAKAYAYLDPDRVAGIVFIDAPHES